MNWRNRLKGVRTMKEWEIEEKINMEVNDVFQCLVSGQYGAGKIRNHLYELLNLRYGIDATTGKARVVLEDSLSLILGINHIFKGE